MSVSSRKPGCRVRKSCQVHGICAAEGDQPPGAAASGDERGTGEVEEPEQHAAEREGHRRLPELAQAYT